MTCNVLQQSTHEPEVVVAAWAAKLVVVGPVTSVFPELESPVIKHPVVDVVAVHSTLTIPRLKMEHDGRVFREPAVTA